MMYLDVKIHHIILTSKYNFDNFNPMDEIDEIQNQWAQQRPDIDTEPMALIGRLLRVTRYMNDEMSKTFTQHGLSNAGFDVLATLLRSGPPHALTPNELLVTMMITSGTMTNRIDQLVKDGLVKRAHSKTDKRSVTIILTNKGRKIIDETVSAHVKTQSRLACVLSKREQVLLDGLLRKYLEHQS